MERKRDYISQERVDNHHPLPKEFQIKTQGRVYDDRTLPLERNFHNVITKQTRFEGVPVAYTIGEIDVDDLNKGHYPRVQEYKKR